MSYMERFFQVLTLVGFLASAPAVHPVHAQEEPPRRCDSRKYTSNDERLDLVLHYFCMNKEGDEPVKLNDRRVEYTIHVKKITFGGGDDSDNEYLVTITREDRKRKDTFIEGDMGAELDNGAMFAILSDIYKEEEKGKKEREYEFDKPEQKDGEKPWKYRRRLKQFGKDTAKANRRYNATLSELERIIRKKMQGRKN